MRFLIVAALAVFPSLAYAGGLTTVYDDPPVLAPPSAPSWTGFYAGAGVTSYVDRQHWNDVIETPYSYEEEVPWERVETEEVHDGWERECSGTPGRHNGNKCQVSELTFGELDLREVRNPWNQNGLRTDGDAGEIVKYQTNSYYGIWLNDNASYRFSSSYGGTAPTSANKPTSNTVVQELVTVISTIVTGTDIVTVTGVTTEEISGYTDSREIGAELFAGYMHDFGDFVGLVEGGWSGDEAYADAAGCADLGRLLTCAGYGTQGPILSANLALSNSWMVGARAAFDDEGTRLGVRAAVRF